MRTAPVSATDTTVFGPAVLGAAAAQLDDLVDEAVTIIREVATECERPVLLFSGGKDSAVLAHLAVAAFAPARLPLPVTTSPR